MMSDVVETVAKAITEAAQASMVDPVEWDNAHENYKFARRQEARSAITAYEAATAARREMLIDWLNAFKADPFSTGADKVDRLMTVLKGGV